MDIYTTNFTYPRTDHHSFVHPTAAHDLRRTSNYASLLPHDAAPVVDDNIAPTVQYMSQAPGLHGCTINATRNDSGTFSFHLSGIPQSVTNARAMIIRQTPILTRYPLKVTRADLSNAPIRASAALRQDFHDRIKAIAAQTDTHITIHPLHPNGAPASPPTMATNGNGAPSGTGYFGLETDRVCDIVITGHLEPVDVARVRCLVAIDEFSGLHADVCEIDHQLQPIVAGVKRAFIQLVQENTNTNIYMPFLLSGLLGSAPKDPNHNGSTSRPNADRIWITGDSFNVQRAKDTLLQTAANVAATFKSTDISLIPRKIDWLLTDKLEDLRQIMRDNGTFIKFPTVPSLHNNISILGPAYPNIRRTIRFIMQLVWQYYSASIWLLPTQYNMMMPQPVLPPSSVLEPMLREIARDTGAEIVFRDNAIFEVHGLDRELVNAMTMLLDLDFIKGYRQEIHIKLELANDQRDFISGKKNGKLNKIHQTCGARIKYETLNEYNFLIDIAGPDASVLTGLQLLQDELPSEISFHVPESYHKRIIGVGGRSIQRIMKKFGVYVKFSNADEFAELGGYNDNMDNVVARTPRKNAGNLELLKQAVLEGINAKDRDFIHEAFNVPRKYHRMLLGEKAPFIHDIEKQTNCVIRFPDKETASDMIDIFGPEAPVTHASTMLMDHVPFEADLSIPPNPDLPALLASAEWAAFVERIKTEVEVNITPFPAPPSPVSSPSPSHGHGHHVRNSPPGMYGREHFFRLRCQRSHREAINSARECLEDFLLQHNIGVYAELVGGAHRRQESLGMDPFKHFDSKLISSGMHAPDSPDYGRSHEHLPGPPQIRRSLRMAASQPDFKTLYHQSGSYMYNHEKLPDHDEQLEDEASLQGGWRPSPLPPMGGMPLHRTRYQPDPTKRGSDSLLNAKFTASSKSRTWTNRAQSLDLTLAFSRVSPDTSSQLGRPHSPTESTIDTGATPSPTSVTAPPFPPPPSYPYPHSHSQSTTTLSVTAGPGSAAAAMAGHRQAQSIDAVASEHADIAQVISGLKGL